WTVRVPRAVAGTRSSRPSLEGLEDVRLPRRAAEVDVVLRRVRAQLRDRQPRQVNGRGGDGRRGWGFVAPLHAELRTPLEPRQARVAARDARDADQGAANHLFGEGDALELAGRV